MREKPASAVSFSLIPVRSGGCAAFGLAEVSRHPCTMREKRAPAVGFSLILGPLGLGSRGYLFVVGFWGWGAPRSASEGARAVVRLGTRARGCSVRSAHEEGETGGGRRFLPHSGSARRVRRLRARGCFVRSAEDEGQSGARRWFLPHCCCQPTTARGSDLAIRTCAPHLRTSDHACRRDASPSIAAMVASMSSHPASTSALPNRSTA